MILGNEDAHIRLCKYITLLIQIKLFSFKFIALNVTTCTRLSSKKLPAQKLTSYISSGINAIQFVVIKNNCDTGNRFNFKIIVAIHQGIISKWRTHTGPLMTLRRN